MVSGNQQLEYELREGGRMRLEVAESKCVKAQLLPIAFNRMLLLTIASYPIKAFVSAS